MFANIDYQPIFAESSSDEVKNEEVKTEEAKEGDVPGRTGFVVEPVLTNEQIDPSISFFYVQTRPGITQELNVRVKSIRKEKSEVNVYISNATTNDAGNVEYANREKPVDESVGIPLTEMVKLKEKKVTVENFEEKVVTLIVTPPAKEYEGVRLGAIFFGTDDGNKEKGAVKSNYGYRIGLMLNSQLQPYNRGGDLEFMHVGPRLSQGQKVIDFAMKNPKPFLLDNVTIGSKLRRKDNEEVIASNMLENVSLAPNSTYSFLTHLGVENLKSGTYVLKVDAKDENNQYWSWEEEFIISKDEAAKINKETSYKLGLPIQYKYIGILLLVLSIGNISYLVWRKRKEN